MAYDNAVSASGKICNIHFDSIDSVQIIPAWLNCLPIKGDLIEAKFVHDQLCSMVERSDRELLGPNNEYLPKVVQVFAEVLLVTEQTASRMITLLRQLQQNYHQPAWLQYGHPCSLSSSYHCNQCFHHNAVEANGFSPMQ